MNHSITDAPETHIDARPLIADEAMRGAVVGFVCSFLDAVPLGLIMWKDSLVDAPGAFAVAAVVVAVGTCGPAVVCACLRREALYLDEQRAIIRTHQQRALNRANFVVTPLMLLLLGWCFYARRVEFLFPAVCVKAACLVVAALVGRAKGRAVVAEMRHSASMAVGQAGGHWDDRGPPPSRDAGPERERLMLSDRDRVTDGGRSGGAVPFGARGEEDQ